MLDQLIADIRASVARVKATYAERKQISDIDPVADGMLHAAEQIERDIDALEKDLETLSTEQYAAIHNVTPQSVGNWIRAGELEAEEGGNGYRIRRSAKRMKKAS